MASRSRSRFLVVALMCGLSAGLAAQEATQSSADNSQAPKVRPTGSDGGAPSQGSGNHGAVISRRDKLIIKTLNEPLFTTEVIVDADGGFDFPYLGHLTALGMTPQQLEADLKKRLNPDWVINPQVTVDLVPNASKRVMVNGSVRNPSQFPFSGRMTVLDALVAAGGTADSAGDRAFIIRGNADGSLPSADQAASSPKTYVDLLKLEQGDVSENYTLNDGDYLFVEKAQLFTITGEVRNPGQFAAHRGLTVQQAVAIAGGLTDKGKRTGIKILRPVDGKKPLEIEVKSDKDFETMQVRPGDTLTVHARII
jgi:polysaccharide export outer membrane protein